MSTNLVNYEVLEQTAADYIAQAEAISDVMKKLKASNDELQNGFQNQTATAFITMYNSTHEPNLRTIVEELQDVARYLNEYAAARRDEDERNAAGLGR